MLYCHGATTANSGAAHGLRPVRWTEKLLPCLNRPSSASPYCENTAPDALLPGSLPSEAIHLARTSRVGAVHSPFLRVMPWTQAVQVVPDVQAVQVSGHATHTPLTAAVRNGQDATHDPLLRLRPWVQAVQLVVDVQAVQIAGQATQTRLTATVRAGQEATHAVPFDSSE